MTPTKCPHCCRLGHPFTKPSPNAVTTTLWSGEEIITRDIDGREVEIPFQIDHNGFYQWGNSTEILGENVELLEALGHAMFEASEL
jgi:hypothetical protein